MTEIKLPHDHGQKIETLCGHIPPAADFLAVSDLFKQFSDCISASTIISFKDIFLPSGGNTIRLIMCTKTAAGI